MNNGDRQTDTGILLPEPDQDKGHPIIQVMLDCFPGALINVVGPDDADVIEWSERIEAARRRHIQGELVDPIPFTSPMYGETCYLHASALEHVWMVGRAWMVKVTPEATRQHRGRIVPVGAQPHLFNRS